MADWIILGNRYLPWNGIHFLFRASCLSTFISFTGFYTHWIFSATPPPSLPRIVLQAAFLNCIPEMQMCYQPRPLPRSPPATNLSLFLCLLNFLIFSLSLFRNFLLFNCSFRSNWNLSVFTYIFNTPFPAVIRLK